MLVMFPDISDIPIHLHNDVTRERKGGCPKQRVKDIAEKPVGRVPANLCRVFRKLKKENYLTDDNISKYTGVFAQSLNPPHQSFKRNASGSRDRS